VADNVEIVRRVFEASRSFWADAGPWREVVGPFFEPDIDYYPVRKWPEGRPCHGVDEVERFFTRFSEAWGEVDWELVEIEAIGDDRVLMRARLVGSGRGSGLEMGGVVHFCYWLRGGRIFRQEDHLTDAGAKRALGIP
jgi:ketosteroid isomerase-like protein